MSWTRFLLGSAMLLIAAVFFASVVCPPLEERGPNATPTLRSGLADALPAPLGELEPIARQTIDDGPGRGGGEVFGVTISVRDAHTGEPLPDARVYLSYFDSHGNDFETLHPLDELGDLHLAGIGANDYWIRAELPGWFPAPDEKVSLPAREGETIRFDLEAGALIRGKVLAVDGSRVRSGVVRFFNEGSGEERIVRVRAIDDGFDSGTIAGGRWTVQFLENQHDPPDPRLTLDLAMVPGLIETVEFTIQRRAMKANPGALIGARLVR